MGLEPEEMHGAQPRSHEPTSEEKRNENLTRPLLLEMVPLSDIYGTRYSSMAKLRILKLPTASAKYRNELSARFSNVDQLWNGRLRTPQRAKGVVFGATNQRILN